MSLRSRLLAIPAPVLRAQSEPREASPPPSLKVPDSQPPKTLDSSRGSSNTRDSSHCVFSARQFSAGSVVVCDAQGHAVATLREDYFKVFEDHKPQKLISHFSVCSEIALHPRQNRLDNQVRRSLRIQRILQSRSCGLQGSSRFYLMTCISHSGTGSDSQYRR